MEERPPSPRPLPPRPERAPARPHLPVARISALAAIAVGAYLVLHGPGEPRWRSIGPGVEFTTLRGDPYCRRGSSGIGVLRLDPARPKAPLFPYTPTPGPPPPTLLASHRLT